MDENIFNQDNLMNRVGFFANKNKMSASDLSRKLGHSRNYIYRLQKGEIKLDFQILQDILEILQVSPSEFFNYDYVNYEKDKQLIETVKKLNIKEREILLTFINTITKH